MNAALILLVLSVPGVDTFLITDDTTYQTSSSTELLTSKYTPATVQAHAVDPGDYQSVQAATYRTEMLRNGGWYWDGYRWVQTGAARNYVTPAPTLQQAQQRVYQRTGLFGRRTRFGVPGYGGTTYRAGCSGSG